LSKNFFEDFLLKAISSLYLIHFHAKRLLDGKILKFIPENGGQNLIFLK
jgi:hypothetical protein